MGVVDYHVALHPRGATDVELHRNIDEWARRWAYTPWYEVRTLLTIRRALAKLTAEVRRRENARTRQLTEDERDQMARVIGHPSAKWCSVHGGRNHYVTSADDPLWLGLVDRGLAKRRSSSLIPDSEAVFHVTKAGRLAVEADHRSQKHDR